MRPIADLNFPIEVLVDLAPTLYEADPEERRLYLKDDIAKLDGVIGCYHSLMLDGEDSIEVGAATGSVGTTLLCSGNRPGSVVFRNPDPF